MKKILIAIAFFVCVVLLISLLAFLETKKYQVRPIDQTVLGDPKTKFTDKEILNAVYSDYRIPGGFFRDVHEKGELILYERTSKDSEQSFFCANDFDIAKQFIDKDIDEHNQKYTRSSIIIETSENEKFFEFKTNYARHKIYKCSYITHLQPGAYNRGITSFSNNYIGTFAQRPVTVENVKELVEFLWYLENGKWSDVKVLSSFTEDSGNSVKHTIFETDTQYGDWGMNDQIRLIKYTTIVDKNSGKIELTRENIKTIKGEHN